MLLVLLVTVGPEGSLWGPVAALSGLPSRPHSETTLTPSQLTCGHREVAEPARGHTNQTVGSQSLGFLKANTPNLTTANWLSECGCTEQEK